MIFPFPIGTGQDACIFLCIAMAVREQTQREGRGLAAIGDGQLDPNFGFDIV